MNQTTQTQADWPTARKNILDFSHFYLVGIKGVAMTSLAQCLLDAGKTVRGSDVAESFVTQPLLKKRGLLEHIDTSFSQPLPKDTQCVVYTSAHGAQHNPQVEAAKSAGIPVFTQAEAIASMANTKKIIAVCGVGGKSTVSAMITWILTQLEMDISYSVGVGDIPGLTATGRWSDESKYFVVEADEYVTEPQEARNGEHHVPRFAYLNPTLIVCTNLQFDHPDVYTDFEHTKQTYARFLKKTQNNTGHLVINGDDSALVSLAENISVPKTTFGTTQSSDWIIDAITHKPGKTIATISQNNAQYQLTLQLPGKYNIHNGVAAIIAARLVSNEPIQKIADTLASFRSTKRRAELIGTKNGVVFYDDYAHHPQELRSVITAFLNWYPKQRVVFAFQPHTYSRTKQLYSEFITALQIAPELVITDIFASARESIDTSISSEMLAQDLSDVTKVTHLPDNDSLAKWIQSNLKPGDICVTLGAGDIYQVHDLL